MDEYSKVSLNKEDSSINNAATSYNMKGHTCLWWL